MAKVIPDHIDSDDPSRDGERIVMQLLMSPDVPGIALYSNKHHNDDLKMVSESDFLYICNRGIITFEVKGGVAITRKDGVWYSTTRAGNINEIHNPFSQSDGCYYDVTKKIKEIYGIKSPQNNFLIGYGVIFPQCIFTSQSADLNTEVLFDCRQNFKDFRSYIDSVFNYWEKRYETQREVLAERGVFIPEKTGLSDIQVKQMFDLFCGDFKVVPSLKLTIQNISQKFQMLTDNQYDALAIAEENKRVVIKGAAGTGKSFLALRQVALCAAMQKRVLYVCYNSNMAEYARCSVEMSPYTTVTTYHALIMAAMHNLSMYSMGVDEISKVFLENPPETEKYDYLIIDEGQDILKPSVLDVLDYFLDGGLQDGDWTIYLDHNQNIFNKDKEYEEAWELMRAVYNPTVFPLLKNCRNTKQITQSTAVVTGIPPVKDSRVDGEPVIPVFYKDKHDFLKQLRARVGEIINGGVSPSSIVILSKHKKENSILSDVESICNLRITEREDIKQYKENILNYYTVQSYKGLESDVVFLIDVEGFDDDNDVRMNYVGMTRAKISLFMFMESSLEMEYNMKIMKGLSLLS